jgi:peptidoglycan/LPS O-acetylase OafA/YrhL
VLQSERTFEFLIKRIFRIYPLYVFAALCEYALLAKAGSAPSIATLLAQLSLLGDFFGVPPSLNGVEWTLRVEIVFYAFMAAVRSIGLFGDRQKYLPYVFVAATLGCMYLAPIPAAETWTRGYMTIYGPFLLLGATCYLFEQNKTRLTPLLLLTSVVFFQYFSLIAIYQSGWLHVHFAALAFLIFLTLWIFRASLTAEPWVLVLSELTYAVYVFHNWLFDYIKQRLSGLGVNLFNMDLQALCVLLLVCWLATKMIEKPGIRLGRTVLAGWSRVGKTRSHPEVA